MVTGLDVPWGIAFISSTDFLVTERPGRVRLVRDGVLDANPVLTLSAVTSRAEGGLLGIVAHPQFASNRTFYLYYTTEKESGSVNRVEKFLLSPDSTSATSAGVILDDIPASQFHDGGRLRFGPDGQLYVGTGDSRVPSLSQNQDSLAGKLLRLTPDGGIPGDNPVPGKAMFAYGIRNLQAFDWLSSSVLVAADHGPSGELGRSGHDEVSVLTAGANLGWPTTWKCDQASGVITPFIVWQTAAPPGGLLVVRGGLVPDWNGSILIATLGSRHLHRVVLDTTGPALKMTSHEVYLDQTYGRLRDVVQAPDGAILVTTSNCDGRGTCGAEGDAILRITKD
jgi:glucose/arabinose dehydrogenase